MPSCIKAFYRRHPDMRGHKWWSDEDEDVFGFKVDGWVSKVMIALDPRIGSERIVSLYHVDEQSYAATVLKNYWAEVEDKIRELAQRQLPQGKTEFEKVRCWPNRSTSTCAGG